LTTSPGGSSALYIHLPFCRAKCRYCDFASFPDRAADIPRYLAALSLEMEAHRDKPLETLYVGGGTPTLLEPGQWRSLMSSVRRRFSLSGPCEATVECNPESVTREKLAALSAEGVNRLSFGLQSDRDEFLARLGRLHDVARFREAWALARSLGFSNVNLDLIFGIPGQTLADWKETLDRALEFSPEHVSAYALSVEEGTEFHRRGVKPDSDLQADMYEAAADTLESAGYVHYEISNFARPGFECRHNLRYWRNLPSVGVGVSAASYENGVRRKNTASLDDYLRAVESGRSPAVEEDRLPTDQQKGEDLMLALRLKEGMSLSPEMDRLYGGVLRRYQILGFLTFDPTANTVRPTRLGWRLSNQLFQELLTPSPA